MKSIFVLSGLVLSLVISGSAFAATAAGTNPDCAKEDHYPLITKKDLATVAASKSATIVDVNSSDSFAKAHVPTAFNYGQNEKNFDTMLPKDKTALIVAYCGGVQCSAWKAAAERACNMGYTNIKHFKEGIAGWTKGTPGALE
jgi:rhodanese-related sulfurtransferase